MSQIKIEARKYLHKLSYIFCALFLLVSIFSYPVAAEIVDEGINVDVNVKAKSLCLAKAFKSQADRLFTSSWEFEKISVPICAESTGPTTQSSLSLLPRRARTNSPFCFIRVNNNLCYVGIIDGNTCHQYPGFPPEPC